MLIGIANVYFIIISSSIHRSKDRITYHTRTYLNPSYLNQSCTQHESRQVHQLKI